jgi:hypothetical protein
MKKKAGTLNTPFNAEEGVFSRGMDIVILKNRTNLNMITILTCGIEVICDPV